MPQRQYKRGEKHESKTPHHRSRRQGDPGRPNTAAQPHYQWISSSEGRGCGGGGGGGGGSAVIPPPHSHPHFIAKNRFEKSAARSEQWRDTVASVKSKSRTVPTKSELSSESSDASITPGEPVKSAQPYRQGHDQTTFKIAPSKSPSTTTHSAATRASTRGEPSHGVSLQFGSSNPGHVDEMPPPQSSLKQETTELTSSKSRKQQPMEDMKQSKSEISNLQLKDKSNVHSPHSSSKKKKYSSSKREATLSTLSTYGKQQVVEREQFKVETADLEPEAQRDMHTQAVSVAPIINRTHEVSLSVPEASMATSLFQQPHSQLQLGISRPQTWSIGMASASLQTPVQQSEFIPSFQPYTMQPQQMMYYGQGLNLPSQVDHQLGSQFVNFSGIPPLHMQNDTPRVAVKITHPETKEELKLDELSKSKKGSASSGTRAHLNVQPQAHPVAYGQYHLMNYYPYMQPNPFSLQNPTSEAFSCPQMLPTSTPLSHYHLDKHGAVMSEHASSASVPSKTDLGCSGKKISSPVSVKSVVNDNNQATISRTPLRVDCSQGKSRIQPEIVIKSPTKGVTKAGISVVSSLKSIPSAVSAEEVLVEKAVNDGKKTVTSGHPDFSKKDLQNLGSKDNIEAQQPNTSSFSDNSKLSSTEVSKCPGAPLKDLKQSDPVSEPPLLLNQSISGSGKLNIIDSQATSSSAEISACASLCDNDAGNANNVNGAELGDFASQDIQPCMPEETPTELENTNTSEHITRKVELHQDLRNASADCTGVTGRKRYSRDFLLKFSSQFVEIPTDFKLAYDMVDGLILGSEVPDDQRYRIQDGSKWSKTSAPSASEPEQQFGIIKENFSVRSSREGNYGRTLHGPISDRFDVGFGSFPHSTSQGGRRSKCIGAEADRWQQRAVIHKGLIPLPKYPQQVMHKAEKKYELHKVSDDEDAKQRRLKAILNKLTPQNFERLFQQVKEVKIDNTVTLSGLISQIFDKALMEPTFCEMYASFCYHLANELPNFVEGHENITFKRLLLNKCQEEFVRGEREQAESSRMEKDGEARFLAEKREERRICARRRMLGNIRLIGELYRKRMLTEKVLHECIYKLLGDYHNPDEDDIEALCKLMSTVGEMMDNPKAKDQIDEYFEVMKSLSKSFKLSSRMRFMLKDVIDLRRNKWNQRRKVEGPKKIEELHNDAAQERRSLANQLTYGSNFTSSNRKVCTNLGPRSSTFQSPQNSRSGGVHVMSPQIHGLASQDVRFEDKHRGQGILSVPYPHRLRDENAMNPGSPAGLSRRMHAGGPTKSSS